MKSVIVILGLLFVSMTSVAAVQVTPVTLTTPESGSAISYSVVLDSPPSAGEVVTITPSSDDFTEGTVSGALTFNLGNYQTAQFVTVTPGASGDGNDGDVGYTISNAVSSSVGGGNYDGLMAASVAVVNQNIEGVGTIVVSPSSGLFINEGANQLITISATGTPSASVSLTLTIVDATESAVSTTSIVLNSGNSFSQAVTLSVPTDGIVDGNQVFSVTTGISTSGDGAYAGINPVDISAVAVDVDVAAVAVPTSVPVLPPLAMLFLMSALGGLAAYRVKKQGPTTKK